MSLFEQLGAGVAQAARPIPLPERSAHDMGLILESGRIQGYVSAYIDTVGARPMGADHSAFHVPGMDRDTTIDFLTAGNRRRDVAVANETLLQALAQERRQTQPTDIAQDIYTRWFNVTTVRALSRHATPTNTPTINTALATISESLLTAVATATDPRIHEITTRLSHGSQKSITRNSALAHRSIQELLTSIMTHPSGRPFEPPSRPSAA